VKDSSTLHLYLIVCLEQIVMLIKESIVEVVGLQLITKWRICVGSWCDSKNKGHLCPCPDPVEDSPALVAGQTGAGRAKRGFGGKDGNEIDPHLLSNTVLATQTFFSDYWCLRSSLIPCHG
jgi:hypothetical protein